jgi:hypothetical protein
MSLYVFNLLILVAVVHLSGKHQGIKRVFVFFSFVRVFVCMCSISYLSTNIMSVASHVTVFDPMTLNKVPRILLARRIVYKQQGLALWLLTGPSISHKNGA